jgi:hypothetical protein
MNSPSGTSSALFCLVIPISLSFGGVIGWANFLFGRNNEVHDRDYFHSSSFIWLGRILCTLALVFFLAWCSVMIPDATRFMP